MDQHLKKVIRGYEQYIKTKGIDEKVIDAYVEASATGFAEASRSEALWITSRAKQIIAYLVQQISHGTLWELEKWCFRNKTYANQLEQYYAVLLVEAKHQIFDSYLQYLERNRDPKDRFYMPKRQQFLKHGIIEGYQGLLDDKYDVLCISQPPGTGKAQPLYSKVLTPYGFVKMGDIHVGDRVLSASGKDSEVIGVYPQGKKPVYEITFDDGSKCRCSDEHLWRVQTRDDRRRGNKYRVVTLKSMMKNVRVESGKRLNYSLDYVGKIDMYRTSFPIHPYVLGVMLGNGCTTSGNFMVSTADKEVLDKFNELLPEGYYTKHKGKYDYRICCDGENAFRDALRVLGIFEKHSYEKHIPNGYLHASHEDRLWLLRGLMDTDGFASKCYAEYTTVSKRLAEDVAELVHSLGGYCSISRHTDCGYRGADGEFIKCRDSYRLCIQFDANHESPFYLPRKREIYKPKRETIKRFVKDIVYVGEEECQCIMIDDPSHLYITDNYIVTHNTTCLKFFNSAVIGWFPRDYNLFYSHSSDITRMYYDGVLQMVQDAEEYTWHNIFPDLQITNTNAKMGQFNVGKYKPFPSLQTASIGSENAGKVRASKFLMIDDLIGKLEEALNKNTLEKIWGAYTVDARQRMTVDRNDKPCKEVIQATRWSTVDPIGRIIQMHQGNPRVRVISIPDIDPQTGKSNFAYEFGGFSEKFFESQAMMMDDISYRCLYKQQPVEREGLLYHEDELRRYSSLPDREPDAVLGVCDTKTRGIDYMVMPVMYQYDNDYYMVDCICDNGTDFNLQQTRLANLIVDHKMQQCEFESNAGGERLAHDVAKLVADKGGICNITTKYTETNKETRIIVNSDWVKKHVLFRDKEDYKPKSDYGIFMNYLLGYSIAGKNLHDDVPDCLANFALYVARKNRIRRTVIIESPI